MSWQDYVDQYLLMELEGGGRLTSGAICGMDGGVWASSSEFPPATTEQILRLVSGFTDEGLKGLQASGPFLGDIKFQMVRSEPGTELVAKCTKGGMYVKRTNSAIVIGIYHDPVTAYRGNQVVEKLADYLIESNM